MGDTGTWVRKPADLHGTWQTDVNWTKQQKSLLSDSYVEGTCASAFRCLQEIRATVFGAGYLYKSNYQKCKWFLKTLWPEYDLHSFHAGWTAGICFVLV